MMKRTLAHSKHALLMTLLMTVLLSVILPLLFTGMAKLIFPSAANGSLIEKNGTVIGSELIGQEFSQARYFWGRMSATTPPYNAAASAATHYSMGNSQLLEKANERMAHFPVGTKIPLSLVTASGSGLDPHITPEAAYFQAERVAKARKLPLDNVQQLIQRHTEDAYLGLIGVARVNVLALNLALDGVHE